PTWPSRPALPLSREPLPPNLIRRGNELPRRGIAHGDVLRGVHRARSAGNLRNQPCHDLGTSTARKPSGSANVTPWVAQYGFAGGIGMASSRSLARRTASALPRERTRSV